MSLLKLADAGIDESVGEIADRGLQVDGDLPGLCLRPDRPVVLARGPRRHGDGDRGRRPAGGAHAPDHRRHRPVVGPSSGPSEQLVLALGPVEVAARRSGLRIALEPTRPQFAHVAFVHTLRDGLAVAHRLGLLPRSRHRRICGGSRVWPTSWPRVCRRIAMVQLADLDFSAPVLERVVPGDGGVAARGTDRGPARRRVRRPLRTRAHRPGHRGGGLCVIAPALAPPPRRTAPGVPRASGRSKGWRRDRSASWRRL